MYPAIVLSIMVIIGVLMMIYVMPSITGTFRASVWALLSTTETKPTGMAMMTVESHIRYLDGAYRGDTIAFDSMVLDCDAKRAHIAHVAKLGDKLLQDGAGRCIPDHALVGPAGE